MRTSLLFRFSAILFFLCFPHLAWCCLEFASFTTTATDNCTVAIAWTFNECRIPGIYYIESSLDDVNFNIIGTQTAVGGGIDAVSYTFTDAYAHPAASGAVTVYYRLIFVSGQTQAQYYSPQRLVALGSASCGSNSSTRCSGLQLSITGTSALCGGATATYNLSNTGYSTTWGISGNTSLVSYSWAPGNGGISITNSSNATGQTITLTTNVEGCLALSLPITLGIPPAPTQMIPNSENVPPNSIAEFLSPGASFWTATNGTITAGQGEDDVAVRVANKTSGSMTVNAFAKNACGTSSALTQSYPIVPGSPNPLVVHPGLVSAVAGAIALEPPVDEVVVPGAIVTSLYPNPASNAVRVTFPAANYTGTFIKIYDLSGHLLKTVITTGPNTDINVSQLARGTYLMEIYDGKQLKNRKLVLQ